MTSLPTEADEVACAMPTLPKGSCINEARRFVRTLMPDESEQVIDNVAESLYLRSRSVHFFRNPPALVTSGVNHDRVVYRPAPAAADTPDLNPGDPHA